ncbi:tetratricopeptide repeat protein [Candidatus Magnetobacterium casense]|uniref:tetratricopeptide repeat protein n=1 Tax=Candidatus Magnetobacterium casense TaxID=1455061 RepID=UPI00069855A9|nr:tetratricopeptide repeat protein [Candidatus Magnetobacterium casensis]
MTKTANSMTLWFMLTLTLLTVLAYSPIDDNDFVSFDDDHYLTGNPAIQNGLTPDSIAWAFKTFYFANWHPLTWLSYLADVSMFGLNPKGFHLINLLFHMASVMFLFTCLTRMTQLPWQSAMVAALFALHPVNVESVAWASERKNVLSTLLWILTMMAYLRYVQQPRAKWYALTLLSFVLGLMAKPMLVTLPVVLLLLDYWPLQRFNSRRFIDLVIEKIPLFIISLLSGVVTIFAQQQALISFAVAPLNLRLHSVVHSYVGYVKLMFWPKGLTVFYPYSGSIQLAHTLLFLVCIVGVTAVAVYKRRRMPYLFVGWLWYLVTLVPVLQLVQVSASPMADRYAYVPLIGVFIALVYGLGELQHRPLGRIFTAITAGCVLVVLCLLTRQQVGYWKNSGTLFKHAVEVTDGNYVANNDYGMYLMKEGRVQEAIVQFSRGLEVMPDNPHLNFNLWSALVFEGRGTEAQPYFLRARPFWQNAGEAVVYKMLSHALMRQKKYALAYEYLQKSLRLDPTDAVVYDYLGLTLSAEGRFEEALEYFTSGIKVANNPWELYFHRGLILKKMGREKEARESFEKSLALNPNSKDVRSILKLNSSY